MQKHCRDYIAATKSLLGNPRMSDKALGELLGYAQSIVARAKNGYMTDPMAMKIAKIIGVDAGEVLMVARLERERDPEVKEALVNWASKTFGLLPLNDTVPAIPAGSVLVAGQDVADVDASIFKRRRQKPKSPSTLRHPGITGGEGGIRTHGTLRYA
jgi:hypothetical protein